MDLSKLLQSLPPQSYIDAATIKCIMKQLLEGVRHCHENRIVHRDLKPANILMTGKENTQVKIADFGLARAFSIPIKPYTKDVVTLYYRAPELLLKMNEYATPIDIWSVGCIFAELVNKKAFFAANNEMMLLNEVFRVLGLPDE
jgi:serine/threonine protein kinase